MVQLWLGDMLIEEHVAPAAQAERYADVIRLRIQGLPNRHIGCERASVMDLAYPRGSRYDPRD
ncbi:hypothetical protein [Kribbella sp. C-35]|uniref:hypothetical protein n=1 Tax=Kribbella sp. C-35 TaxID=2789276 RepID=UPI00397D472D